MLGRQSFSAGFALLALTAVAALASSPAQAARTPKLIECQKPLTTGEEIFGLDGVSAKTACPVVRALARWEYLPGHIDQHVKALYRCTGPGKHTPALVLRVFEGWRLSTSPAGDFRMSQGASSFDVTGTDFPLNCS